VYALVLNDAVQPPEFRARQSYVDDWILDRENLPDASGPPPDRPRSLALSFFVHRVESWRLGRLPVFRGRRTADLWVHPVDHHPNEVAHRLAAESLAPVVTRLVESP
jgi:hypothetical protein